MELGREEERVAGDLGDLHPVPVLPRKDHPLLLDPGDVVGVHLVPVAVPLDYLEGAVDLLGEGPLPEDRLVVAEAHRRPHILDPLLLGEDGDDGMRRLAELPGARAVEAEDVAAELDDGELHPKAYPQIGDAVFSGVPDRRHLASGPPGAEAPGDEDPVEVGEEVGGGAPLQLLRVDPGDLRPGPRLDPGVLQRLADREVGILHVGRPLRPGGVLADDRHLDGVFDRDHLLDQLHPVGPVLQGV